jgi:hypothetical protein
MEISRYRLGLTAWNGIPVFVVVVNTKDVETPPTPTAPDDPNRATSKAQVAWARWQLKRIAVGEYAPCSTARLKAMANTPLKGLPERAPRKTAKKARA